MKKILRNDPKLKDLRITLRRNETKTEKILWSYLRNKNFQDFKFYRQYSVGNYILDFYCPKKKLAIELDGGHHAEKENKEYDKERTLFLNDLNIKVLRFWNNEVLNNLEGVFEEIGFHLGNKK